MPLFRQFVEPKNIKPGANIRPLSLWFKNWLKEEISKNGYFISSIVYLYIESDELFCLDGYHRVIAALELVNEKRFFLNNSSGSETSIPCLVIENVENSEAMKLADALNKSAKVVLKPNYFHKLWIFNRLVEDLINKKKVIKVHILFE